LDSLWTLFGHQNSGSESHEIINAADGEGKAGKIEGLILLASLLTKGFEILSEKISRLEITN